MNYKCALRVLAMMGVVFLGGCVGMHGDGVDDNYETPGVDYVEQLDVYSAPHKDSFLNQLAMNYRSYAVYNARTSGYPDIGELFAQKAIGAFSGETPFPESLDNWKIRSEDERFEIYNSYNDLMDMLKGDALQQQPKLAAESQAKFDCWLSAAASGYRSRMQKSFFGNYAGFARLYGRQGWKGSTTESRIICDCCIFVIKFRKILS